jgi:hypothetical protein
MSYLNQWSYAHAVNAFIKLLEPNKIILEAEVAVLIMFILWRIMLY